MRCRCISHQFCLGMISYRIRPLSSSTAKIQKFGWRDSKYLHNKFLYGKSNSRQMVYIILLYSFQQLDYLHLFYNLTGRGEFLLKIPLSQVSIWLSTPENKNIIQCWHVPWQIIMALNYWIQIVCMADQQVRRICLHFRYFTGKIPLGALPLNSNADMQYPLSVLASFIARSFSFIRQSLLPFLTSISLCLPRHFTCS